MNPEFLHSNPWSSSLQRKSKKRNFKHTLRNRQSWLRLLSVRAFKTLNCADWNDCCQTRNKQDRSSTRKKSEASFTRRTIHHGS